MKAKSILTHVEPLEGRIAPAATIFIGAQGPFENGSDTEYREGFNPDPNFPNPPAGQTKFFTDASTSVDPISAALGVPAHVEGVSNTYFFRLEAGDLLRGFTESQSYGDLIKVNKGTAIAFFVDYDHDNDYDPGELTGVSLSANADVLIGAKLNGDIVTNLNDHGTKGFDDDTLDMAGLVGPKQGIASLEVSGGSVFGSILSGGDIKKLNVVNNVERVLAGTAANGMTFDFFGPQAPGQPDPVGGFGTVSFIAPAKQVGASISNAIVGSIGPSDLDPGPYLSKTGHMEAGGGGFGAKGGSLTHIEITKDTTGFQLLAGGGGGGNAGLGIQNGGAGGDLTNIYVSGRTDNTPNSPQDVTPIQLDPAKQPGIVLQAGAGGEGTNSGKGGDGGKATNIFVGYELFGATPAKSVNLLADSVLVGGGAGGSGKTGGKGADINNAHVRVQTPDINGDEIALVAGTGGASIDPAGKAGAGGSIIGAEVVNQVSTFNADASLRAGDGGITVGAGVGAAGGSVLKSSVMSFDMQILAGNGSDGKTGGLGGSINNLDILNGTAGDREVVAHNVLLNAGKGGNGSNGNGGNGGAIFDIFAEKTDVQQFLVNTGIQGNGGSSINGKGGTGGAISLVAVKDGDSGFGFSGNFNFRSGSGGDGTKGGGNAGALQKMTIDARNSNFTVTGGNGGNATGVGNGGAGGNLLTTLFGSVGQVQGVDVFGTAIGGTGGAGKGKNGSGGAGGNIQNTNMSVDGVIALRAGSGGSGEDVAGGGAAGRGGNIIVSGGFSLNAAGEMRGGDAGAGGAKPGAGGSVIGQLSVSGLLAATDLTIVGGNGSSGGAGGDIKNMGYGSSTGLPVGNILVQGGQGSAEGKNAGKGGTLDSIFGSVSAGVNSTTRFFGGDGGAADFLMAQNTTVEGTGANKEIQTIDLSKLANSPDGKFTLSFTNGAVTSTTGQLSFASTATEIDSALEALQSVINLGAGGDNVGVTKSVDGKTLTVTFNPMQDVAPLSAQANVGVKGGDGGAANNIQLSLGGAAGALLTIEAGDAGDAKAASKGANGGNVKGVGVIAIDSQTIFRHIGAGNGGAGLKTGGNGGSIDQVSVDAHDIGLRTGAVFGYDAMGGLFVGTAGKAGVGGKDGLAGSVTNVNADSIASIVAGRGAIPEFAEKVANVYLNGANQLVSRNGAFGQNGAFRLTFGADTTALIPKNSLPAVVDGALEQLASIQALPGTPGDKVSVTQGPVVNGSPTYNVKWNSPGDQGSIIAFEEQGAVVTEDLKGQIIPFKTFELVTGGKALAVTETTSGQTNLLVTETVKGDTPVLAVEVTKGVPGSVDEVQQIDVSAIGLYSANGMMQFSFQGDKTQQFPANASAAAIDAALEQLPAIQALSPFPDRVTVTQSASFIYLIEFNTASDVPDVINADLFIPETQRLTLGALGSVPNAQFTLSFKNISPGNETETQTTAPIAANATAIDIQNALNNLPAVQASGNVTVTNGAGGTFNIQFGNIGEQSLLTAHGFLQEVQTLDFDSLPVDGKVQIGYGSDYVLVDSTATAADIKTGLNNLASVQAAGGVDVASSGATTFKVTFNTNGDKLPIGLDGFQREQQTLDLGATGAAATGEYLFNVSHNVPTFEGLKGSQFISAVNTLVDGAIGSVDLTTVQQGTGGTVEVQHIDLTGVAGIVGGEFTLTFNGVTTTFISKSGTGPQVAAAIQTALNNIGTIAAAGGVNVTQTDPVNNDLLNYDITFNVFGNRNQITGAAGARDFQNLDIDTLGDDATGEFVVHFLGQTTGPLPSNALPVDVEAALNALSFVQAAGGVTVTAGPGTTHSFDVQFQAFGNAAKLSSEGGGDTTHEIQYLDLSAFANAGAAATYRLTFGSGTTTVLNGTSTAGDIEAAMNAMPSVQNTRTDGTGTVTVTEIAPGSGKFTVDFDIFGDQAKIAGTGQLGTGQTVRLPHDATAADVKAAIETVSISPVNVTQNANGTFNVDFTEKADQPLLSVTGYIHEVQTVDLFVTGDFTLRFGGFTTNTLAANATAAQVKTELEMLPSIQALTPGPDDVIVTAGPNSSFHVVLNGDGDLTTLAGTQLEPMFVTEKTKGSVGPDVQEVQQIGYSARGNFDSVAFIHSNIVGGISDFNELGANIFKWTEVNGIAGFNLGDKPIDGIVMAKFFDQATVNFTPEAKLTLNGFFDNENFL